MTHWPLSARKPYPVQVEAYNRGKNCDKFGQFLEQGMGKTELTFAEFLRFLQMDEVDAMVIVAPPYLKPNWSVEAKECGFDIPMFTWPKVPDIRDKCWNDPHVFVINNEAVRHSGGEFLQKLLESRRYMFGLDESSSIKNFGSDTSKKVIALAQYTQIRRALCGTPQTQSVMDWYPQLRFIGELNGVNPYQFRNRHAVMGGHMGKQVIGIKNEGELQELLKSCCFIASKADWAKGLPEKLPPSNIYFDLTNEQQKLYRQMELEYCIEFEDELVAARQAIHAAMKLQQISRGFIIDTDSGETHELVSSDKNPALRALEDSLGMVKGKTIIFTHYQYSTKMVFERLKQHGAVVLRGGLTPEELTSRKKLFNEDPNIRYCVGQLSVASRGHTLLGTKQDRCHTVKYFENTYSLEVRKQSEDRPHRWGADTPISYFDFVGSSTDLKIITALQKKNDLVEAVVASVRNSQRST